MNDIIIPTIVRNQSQLARQFNLQNVNIIRPSQSDFILPDDTSTPDPQLYLSVLGTKVLIDLTFVGKTYKDELGNVYSFPDFTLETVLLSVTQNKNIVKTQIQGRKGTIKEYINLGDYDITINGILTGGNGQYPKSDVQTLSTIMNCNESIEVTSWYLQIFGINAIIIDSGASINQNEGQYSIQPFSIPCVSDDDVNLRF